MKKIKLRTWINVALVAGIYVALTLALAPLSYGAIQFRLSEMLMILILYNPIYSISLSVGCLLANLASPMATIDVIFGTLATVISAVIMIFIKNKTLSSLIPSVVNGIVIAIELYVAYELPILLSMVQVFIGEFVVVSIIGLSAFRSIEKNEVIVEGLELKVDLSKKSFIDKYISPKSLFIFAVMVIGIILFFKLGIHYVGNEEEKELVSLFDYTFGLNGINSKPYFIIVAIIPILIFISSLIFKNIAGFIVDIILSLSGIGLVITSMIIANNNIDIYYYAYFIYFGLIIFVSFYVYISNRNKKSYEINDNNEIEKL